MLRDAPAVPRPRSSIPGCGAALGVCRGCRGWQGLQWLCPGAELQAGMGSARRRPAQLARSPRTPARARRTARCRGATSPAKGSAQSPRVPAGHFQLPGSGASLGCGYFYRKAPRRPLSFQSHASVTHDLSREGKTHSLGNVIRGTAMRVDISPASAHGTLRAGILPGTRRELEALPSSERAPRSRTKTLL